MHRHDVPSNSALAKWTMRIAIVVFVGLGILELVLAAFFHRVALGVDGAHNLADGVVYSINLRAQYWATLDGYSFWTCTGEPGAPLFTSGAVVVGAVFFTIYESTIGGGTGTHQLVALGLLGISFAANALFTIVIYWDRQRQRKGHRGHDRHLRNVLVHAFWDTVATLVGALAYGLIVAGMTNSLDPILAWAGTALILWGHRKEIPEGWRELNSHRVPGHEHHHEPDPAH